MIGTRDFIQNKCNIGRNSIYCLVELNGGIFFFSAVSGFIELLVTALLSHKILHGPSMGIPNMRNLYRNDIFCSVAVRNATNSEPKVELSTVFCFLENHDIGALFK